MNRIRHVFFDIGGVLATNGWDRTQRRAAVEHFGLDAEDFQLRHEEMVGPLEEGQVSIDEYLAVTIFCRPRSFAIDSFRDFIFAQSRPYQETIQIAREVADGCRYWVMTLNNESAELNRHRIMTFGLNEIFDAYLSSCWLGLRKPTRKFYDRALSIAQADPRLSVFIDDREQNLTPAASLGMSTILYKSPEQLRTELAELGVVLNPST
ncbi:MAG TPA: HAD family phosphatase [Gemmatimonadaceae bacterium]|nr:HAD family phosphatase [Gemmatimonadaceae bacterium]